MEKLNKCRFILMDIEGTITSIHFVHDVLFAYSRETLENFLEKRSSESQVSEILQALEKRGVARQQVVTQFKQWIDEDRKDPLLKKIQGLQWKEGYQSGRYRGHLYPEVASQWRIWRENRAMKLGIYSSGSVEAQKLLLQYSVDGNLLEFIDHFFDTRVGDKKSPQSYQTILQELKLEGDQVLFLSDIPGELEAAQAQSMRVCQLVRPDSPNKWTSHFPKAFDLTSIPSHLFG